MMCRTMPFVILVAALAACEPVQTNSGVSFDREPRLVERTLSGSRFSVDWLDVPRPVMTVTYPARVAVSDNRLLAVVFRLTGCVGQDVESFARAGPNTTALINADCRTVWADDSQRRVQIATVSRRVTAERLVAQLAQDGITATAQRVRDRGQSFYRVTSEPYRSTKELSETLRIVRSIGYRDAFVITQQVRN